MKSLIPAAITCYLVIGTQAFAVPPEYALQLLGDASKVEGINASGVITGWRLSPSPARSFVVGIDHPYELLPLPAGYISSLSWDINDAGVVVGEVSGAGQQMAAAWYPDGKGSYTIELLGTLPGHVHSVAYAINNRGDIVGDSINPGWSGGPTVWFNSPSGIVDLGPDAPSRPTAVSDNGLVVGWGSAMFDLDTMTGLPLPPGGGGLIWGMNNHGDLCGSVSIGHDSIAATRWTQTHGWEILGGGADPSVGIGAYDINDSHVTVGLMVVGSIYFDAYGLLSLHDLLTPEFANWTLETRFSAINNAGQIALTAGNSSTFDGGVVILTPLGEMIIPGDVNGDAVVNLDDYCAWQENPIDLNGDGVVDDADEQWLIDRLADLGFIVTDCNSNGIGDHCDIVDGVSQDCDENGLPDECQPDCNSDGVPDACEPDCNGNGVADPCDIAQFTSLDCNENGIPDECDQGGISEIMNIFDPPIELVESSTTVDDLLMIDTGVIDDVDFTIDIGYRIGNLTVLLSHGGVTITLIDRPGYPEFFLGSGQLGYDIILDDEGTGGPIEDEGNFGSPFEPITSPPSFTPNDPLSTFDGMPSEGVWTVTVITNELHSPSGSFNDWGLFVTRASVPVGPCDCNDNGVPDDEDIANGTSADDNGNSVPDECEAVPGDVNGDGVVDIIDLLSLLADWGACPGPSDPCPADLDGDGTVGILDLLIVLANWG